MFLRSDGEESHERVVLSHYGGEVSVIELLRIMLRHSTHHVRQVHWFMENELLVVPLPALTIEDLAGVVTPDELFETVSPLRYRERKVARPSPDNRSSAE